MWTILTLHLWHSWKLKFIYSEKATNFFEISTLLLSGCTVDKSKVEILPNFVAFSEYTNLYNEILNPYELGEPILKTQFALTDPLMTSMIQLQVNLFQKPSFLHRLTHNMTRGCLFIYKKVQNMLYKKLFVFLNFVLTFRTILVHNMFWCSMYNLSSYCGLTDLRMRASDSDLPVQNLTTRFHQLT